MGLSQIFGCFRPDAAPSKRNKKRDVKDQVTDQPPRKWNKTEARNKEVAIQKTKDHMSSTSRSEAESRLQYYSPRDPSDTHRLPATLSAGEQDNYTPEPWSMGSVARLTSQILDKRGPAVLSTKETVFSPEPKPQQHESQARAPPKDAHDYWSPFGTGVRATDLLGLPKIDIKQLRAQCSDVKEGDEAEGVRVEPYIG